MAAGLIIGIRRGDRSIRYVHCHSEHPAVRFGAAENTH